MKTTDPIRNDENVIAITEKGKELKYRFGNLKQDFQSKKIKEAIKMVFVPRTGQYYHIYLSSTKGFKFEKRDGK